MEEANSIEIDPTTILVRYNVKLEKEMTPEEAAAEFYPEDEVLRPIIEALFEGNEDEVVDALQYALQAGKDPLYLIDYALMVGMDIVSRLYDDGVLYLPDVVISAHAMTEGIEYCKKRSQGQHEFKGKVVSYVAEGDMHDIGKKIVTVLLRANGYEVIDLGRDVPASDIEDALQFMSTKELEASMEICSDCIYKFILTLSDTYADTMTKQEKADEIRKYVDKFSLMIAIKHSDMDDMMEAIGSEDDIEEGVDSFAFLRSYLVQLLEQQSYWSRIHYELNNEKADDWLIKLAQMREVLARLEFQFYSQTLQLRDIADFNLLIKMLQFILKTSDEILLLNKSIHTEIRSERFMSLVKDDERFKHLEAYGEKSRTVEHNFSNIWQILSRL